MEINRRDFIRRAAATTAGVSLSMAGVSTDRVLGANDRIRLGVIGTGRQGVDNMENFMRHGVEVAGVCDVYEPNLANGLKAAGGKAKTYKDFRQLLDDKEIDVVINATPDHWHALPTVMACQAGKDVYTEKPVSVVVDEGKKMVEAARKYKRVVQVGLWQRSNVHFQKAVELVQGGLIGKVSFVRTWNYSNIYPEGIGNPPDSDPPPGLDWDMWLGPAPKVPFNWNRFGVGDRWSTFRYFYDYANGWPGDWGVHLLDIVQWAMKVDGPTALTASGSKFFLKDNSDTPDTLQITLEYPNFVATYENRLINANSMYGHGYGIEFHGTDGTMFVDRGGFQVYPERKTEDKKEVDRTATMHMDVVNDGLFDHVGNLLDCMKTRKLPASDIEIGHRSSSTCLLANVALRTRERIEWDVTTQRLIKGGAAAQKLLSREYRAPWKLVV
ncbi:MAG TPA: Gfo/Idh/MocA family oxidoreductase [Terriglobia bacterium]|jgi:predicted dehydrogenase|nr:Gfo/Idh/MocA family oxidoreductase [Terriglobia bacterium]